MPLGDVVVAAFNKTWTGKVLIQRKVVREKSLFGDLFIYSGHIIIDEYYKEDISIVLLKSIAVQKESKTERTAEIELRPPCVGLKIYHFPTRSITDITIRSSEIAAVKR